MKRSYPIHLSLLSTFFLLLLFLASPGQALAQSSGPVVISGPTPGYGIEYTSPINVFGPMKDLGTVESEDYVCTVGRTHQDFGDKNYLLIRVKNKNSGIHWYDSLFIGSFDNGTPDLLSIELAHDEQTVIIATNVGENENEGVLAVTYKFSTLSVLFQRRYEFNSIGAGGIFDIQGIQLQRRFNSAGGKAGFNIAVLGNNGGSPNLAVLELNADLTLIDDHVTAVPLGNLPSSDSNDEYMIVTGSDANGNGIRVVRYNNITNTFDFSRQYTLNNANMNAPSIAYNINTSTGNRNGFFIAAQEVPFGSGTPRPVVFRARNNGNIVWGRNLEVGTFKRGLIGASGRCQALTNALTSADPSEDEYKRYSLDPATGNVVTADCYAAAVKTSYTVQDFRAGFEDRPLLSGAVTGIPSNWFVYRVQLGFIFPNTLGFVCPGDQEYPASNRSINVGTVEENTVNTTSFVTNEDLPIGRLASSEGSCLSSNKTQAGSEGPAPDAQFSAVLFPNPVAEGSTLYLRTQSPHAVEAELSLSNAMGQTLLRKSVSIGMGESEITVPVQELPAGIYLIQLSQGQDKLFQGKVIRN